MVKRQRRRCRRERTLRRRRPRCGGDGLGPRGGGADAVGDHDDNDVSYCGLEQKTADN
jgi:hypothetical protein